MYEIKDPACWKRKTKDIKYFPPEDFEKLREEYLAITKREFKINHSNIPMGSLHKIFGSKTTRKQQTDDQRIQKYEAQKRYQMVKKIEHNDETEKLIQI